MKFNSMCTRDLETKARPPLQALGACPLSQGRDQMGRPVTQAWAALPIAEVNSQ